MNPVWPSRTLFHSCWQLSWLAFGLLLAAPAWGHGVEASWRAVPTFEIQARYDTGEPMRSAQVTVFAPSNPSTPWQEGQTDAQGRFWLQPDPELKGLWQVHIRQAGHGVVVKVPVGEGLGIPSPSSPGFGPLQRGVMAACVIWGCLGTALFFLRPRPAASVGGERPSSEVGAAALEQD
jgi:nickel transport protein